MICSCGPIMLRAAIFCSLLIASVSSEGSYLITTQREIQPGADHEVHVVIINAIDVQVGVSLEVENYNNGQSQITIIANVSGTFSAGSPGKLILPIPNDLIVTGSLWLRIRGSGGLQFERREYLSIRTRVFVSFIQTDKAIYKPGQLVRIRLFGVDSSLQLYTGAISYEIKDPNGNKIKSVTNATSETSVVQDSFQLSDEPLFGTWAIQVILVDASESSSQTFEVAVYELPKFEVTVDTQPYALIKDELLTGTITAKYTFGQPVKGFVEIHVGPNQGPDQCGNLPKSTQIGLEINGNATFSIPREDIDRVVPLYDGREVRITAFVKEEATGVRLNGSTKVTFRNNEYVVKFTENTPAVFRGGLSYRAFIQVTTPDGKPPVNKNLTVSVYTTVTYQLTVPDQALYNVDQFTGTYGLPGQNLTVPPSGLLTVDIVIPGNATSITTKATLGTVEVIKTAQKMFSPSNNYLQLSLENKAIKSGTTLIVTVAATEPVGTLYYKVHARNSLVVSGVVEGNNRTSFTFELPITSAFAPVSHLFVFYIRGTEEIIADALSFQVEGLFTNEVTVSFNKNETEPNKEVILQGTATPGSQIFFLAVDTSVSLLKTGNDITPERVNTEVSQFDSGQKPSDPQFPLASGATTVQELYSANNLILVTDVPTPYPQSRFDYLYNDVMEEPMSLRRHDISYDSPPGATSVRLQKQAQLQEIEHIRQYFPEVWLWSDLLAGENGTASISATVPDTITSWIANAFATHPTDGLGVALNTATLTVFKNFFVSFNLPTGVIRGEQLVLVVVVYNYLKLDLDEVVLTLKGSSKFQSVKPSKNGLEVLESGDQVVTIKVKSQEQGVVYFPILFTTIGNVDIEVAAQSTVAADAVRRTITVQPEGAPASFNYPLFISLNEKNNTFSDAIEFPLPPSAVNGSDRSRIKATGDLIGSSLYSFTDLIQLPTGCGEQSLSRTSPIVFIAIYLQVIGQFFGQRKDLIFKYLETGYQRQMNYQRNDGSFSAFGNSDESGSTWLTAEVIVVFVEASAFIYVDKPLFLFRAADWLVDRQNKDGSFNEFGKLLDSSIQGSGKGPLLTASVLRALLKVQSLVTVDCPAGNECYRATRWANATANAVRNLESLVDNDSINDQLTLASVSYALAQANSSRAEIEYAKLQTFARKEGRLTYWADNSTINPNEVSEFVSWRPPRIPARSNSVLITSYAILYLTARDKPEEAFPSVLWLTTQRNPSGGFVSSQDTSVGLQALSEYARNIFNIPTNINIKVSNGAVLAEFIITKDNSLDLQIKELSRAPPRVDILASGIGFALVEVTVLFSTTKALSTPSFDVSIVLLDDGLDSFNLLICTKWLFSRDSGMVVQEISIPSGFAPELESLGNIAGLSRSERRGNNVNVYFDRIGATSTCYSIRMTRTDKVVRIQENNVKTYSYYNPTDRSLVFYQPKRLRDSTACDVAPVCI